MIEKVARGWRKTTLLPPVSVRRGERNAVQAGRAEAARRESTAASDAFQKERGKVSSCLKNFRATKNPASFFGEERGGPLWMHASQKRKSRSSGATCSLTRKKKKASSAHSRAGRINLSGTLTFVGKFAGKRGSFVMTIVELKQRRFIDRKKGRQRGLPRA